MVIARSKGNSDAGIAAEEQNHAALDIPRVLFGEIPHLGHLARDNQRADEEGAVGGDNRDSRTLENAEQVQCIRDEHHPERDAQNPRGTLVRVAHTRMAVNEQGLHHHEEADAKQRVVAAVVQKMGIVVQNLEAEICTQGHSETGLQEIAVPPAEAIFADKEHDDRHDGSNRELGDILVVAAFNEALFNGAATVEHKPVHHEECYHEDADDN